MVYDPRLNSIPFIIPCLFSMAQTPLVQFVVIRCIVEFSRLGTNVECCKMSVECLVVLRFMFWEAAVGSVVGLVFSVAATGATLLEGDSRKGFSIGVRLD